MRLLGGDVSGGVQLVLSMTLHARMAALGLVSIAVNCKSTIPRFHTPRPRDARAKRRTAPHQILPCGALAATSGQRLFMPLLCCCAGR